jgi:hypothetical protein
VQEISSNTFTPPHPLKTAVLFLVFNRPDTTKQVFEAIRKARPPRFYVAADGPKADKAGEAEKVKQVRRIATQVDWDCEVKTLFRDKNLGCKYGVGSGIDWFFENEEMGIILEDDTLPHPDFFGFCQNLLNYYYDDERVWIITGDNFQQGHKRGDAAYYFSKYNHCWGWSTWRRAWKHYQGDLPYWKSWKQSADWQRKTPDPVERSYWERIFDRVRRDEIDSWAYPWTACVWYHGGLTATPNVNLVTNIGFGPDATHTTADQYIDGVKVCALGDLVHPKYVQHDVEADQYVFNNLLGGKKMRWPRRGGWLLKKIVFLIGRFLKQNLHRTFTNYENDEKTERNIY